MWSGASPGPVGSPLRWRRYMAKWLGRASRRSTLQFPEQSREQGVETNAADARLPRGNWPSRRAQGIDSTRRFLHPQAGRGGA